MKKRRKPATKTTNRITALTFAVIIAFSSFTLTAPVRVQANPLSSEFYGFVADLLGQARIQEIYNETYQKARSLGVPAVIATTIRTLAHREYIVQKFARFWVMVRYVNMFVGVDEMTKDYVTKREIFKVIGAKFYFWPKWSFYFDTTQTVEEKKVEG